jgi:acetylornithine deacetylase/succinyl-diaminopimelate desuccinylase-like protein
MGIDWQAVETEVTGYLQDLLRFDTTNPPGNEILCAEYIAGVLKREGLDANVTASEPGRGNVTALLQGGDQPTLMLLGHTDVVAAEPNKWSRDPFCGDLYDGCVWGRGALDMKNMVAVELMVFLLLKREGITLNRNVIYAATADEEAGKGMHGIGWLIENHSEQVDARYVITEGGGADFSVNGKRFFTCQTGQKGIFRFRLIAKGDPGHASIPHANNAIVKLGRALDAIAQADWPVHVSPTLKAFFDAIATTQDDETATLLHQVSDPTQAKAVLDMLPFVASTRAELGALLCNTTSPTMLSAGSKINVIPTEATAWIDGRLVPGQTGEIFLADIRRVVGDEIDIVVDQYTPPLEMEIESPLYQTIVSVMAEHEPNALVVPSLMTGGTDAKHICPRKPDTQVYGFMPYCQIPGQTEAELIHGHDERTSVENLVFATKILYDVVCRFCEDDET